MRSLLFLVFAVFVSCGPVWDAKKELGEESAQYSASIVGNDAKLKIMIFDVGEGDSALIMAPDGESALIDTGLRGTIKNIPEEAYLKYLFITHPDNDHDGDIAGIGMAPVSFKAGDIFRLGDRVEISVLAKDCEYSDGTSVECEEDDDNAHSAAMLVTYGSFSYLTAGDLPGGGGEPPYQTVDLETHLGELAGDIDVLHIGHHGSNTSTNAGLLALTRPEAAVISVGNGNDFWHPHKSVIERLLEVGVRIYQTERGWLKDEFLPNVNIIGDITIESDGISYDIH